MKLTDLKLAINKVLKERFPDHKNYRNDEKEGFKRPCFFVQIFPIAFEYSTVNYTSNKLMIVINYFSKNRTQLENLKMHDTLKEAFGRSLKVNDRYLHLRNIRSDEADGTLQFKFDLNFFEGLEKDLEDYELMRELIINKEE